MSGRRIGTVGDSITFGLTLPSPSDAYPSVLQALRPGDAIENDGHSNTTAMVSPAAGVAYTLVTEYPRATAWVASGGDTVILLGMNDGVPANQALVPLHFTIDLTALVEHFAATSRVFLCTTTASRNPAIEAQLVAEINPRIKTVATATGAHLIDLHPVFLDHPEYVGPDLVHPTAPGASAIAHAVQGAIEAADAPGDAGGDTDSGSDAGSDAGSEDAVDAIGDTGDTRPTDAATDAAPNDKHNEVQVDPNNGCGIDRRASDAPIAGHLLACAVFVAAILRRTRP